VNLTYFGKILVVFFDAELLSLKTAIQVRIDNFYITILVSPKFVHTVHSQDHTTSWRKQGHTKCGPKPCYFIFFKPHWQDLNSFK
jgi:hypothetical protein